MSTSDNTAKQYPISLNKEDLECSVCYEQFDSSQHLPTTLPCGHDICSECLRNIYYTPKCPTCRAEFPSTIQFKPNVNLVEIIRRVTKKLNDPEKKCSSICTKHQKEIEYVCLSERTSLCRDCLFFENHGPHEKETLVKFIEKTNSLNNIKINDEKQAITFFDELFSMIENRKIEVVNFIEHKFDSLIHQITSKKLRMRDEVKVYFDEVRASLNLDLIRSRIPSLQLDLHEGINYSIIDFDVTKLTQKSEGFFNKENLAQISQKLKEFLKCSAIEFKNDIEDIQKFCLFHNQDIHTIKKIFTEPKIETPRTETIKAPQPSPSNSTSNNQNQSVIISSTSINYIHNNSSNQGSCLVSPIIQGIIDECKKYQKQRNPVVLPTPLADITRSVQNNEIAHIINLYSTSNSNRNYLPNRNSPLTRTFTGETIKNPDLASKILASTNNQMRSFSISRPRTVQIEEEKFNEIPESFYTPRSQKDVSIYKMKFEGGSQSGQSGIKMPKPAVEKKPKKFLKMSSKDSSKLGLTIITTEDENFRFSTNPTTLSKNLMLSNTFKIQKQKKD